MLLPIFLIGIMMPAKSFCQKKNRTFTSIGMQADISKNYGLGGRFIGGANINELLLVGLGVGFAKIDKLATPILPVFAHFSIGDFSKKTFPYFVAEPGFGLYKRTTMVGNVETTTKGKLSFYGGAGMGVTSGKKSKFIITVGYSLYGLNTDGVSENIKGVAFKFGFVAF
jgi:hypothetical protein